MSEDQNESTSKETLIVASKVKAYIKSKGFMTAGDAIEGLNEEVYRLIDKALERTASNKRTTARSTDF
ncbi:hypothetical protein EHQ58_03130 [Leptospira ognonensis]|jgi:hypothetical protein|uniref:DUF1931 domain-containing protein n=1 Tax=Leptospira ognonensis TaxID=2484945 RepID=A0A4R9K957_9LEPT|nr:hypothetical protein [Leptospira ognonensis]MCZ8156558.1 hypothetical protein [Leptospira sp.]MDZ4725967.1 hypothetical protein [Leptospira sp.]TGL62212.1 hypothetical protein EHQ58_03130 [Leptospira ognonensis]